jgi:hypothetical protein
MERTQPTFGSKLKGIFRKETLIRMARDVKRDARREALMKKRYPNVRLAKSRASGKCQGCSGPLGIVHEGQHKRFCHPDCRAGRILPRAYNQFKTA